MTLKFYSEAGLPCWTGLKADNLKSLLEKLKQVSEASIYYHVHHALLRRSFTEPDLSNDFARWIWEVLGERGVAERVACIDPTAHRSLEEVREFLVHCLERAVGESERVYRVPEGREFHFLEVIRFVYPTGVEAVDLQSFRDGLDRVGRAALFFHMVSSPLRSGRLSNDFSDWLSASLREQALAEQIGKLSPFSCDLWSLRKRIVELVERRLSH